MSVGAEKVEAKGSARETVRIIIHALILALIVRVFLFQPFNIPSGSMIPTLLIGDYLFVSKYSYGYSRYSFPGGFDLFSGRILAGEPKPGDVVVFKLPRDNETDYIKRVIGLPGDRVRVTNGLVYVNDYPLDEPYIAAPPVANMREVVVPDDSVFVMGDNRNVSSDSRSWGPLEIDDIIGKAVFVYWPLDKIRVVEHYELNGALNH